MKRSIRERLGKEAEYTRTYGVKGECGRIVKKISRKVEIKLKKPPKPISYAVFKQKQIVTGAEWNRQREDYFHNSEKALPFFYVLLLTDEGDEKQAEFSRYWLKKQTYRNFKVLSGRAAGMKARLLKEAGKKGECYVLELPAGDSLSPDYFYKVAARILTDHPLCLYTDHDSEKGEIASFKPDFSLFYLMTRDYIGVSVIIDKDRYLSSAVPGKPALSLLSVVSELPLDTLSEKALFSLIAHIPEALYHKEGVDPTQPVTERERMALQNREIFTLPEDCDFSRDRQETKRPEEEALVGRIMEKLAPEGKLSLKPDGFGGTDLSLSWDKPVKLSVIIPNKDHKEDLKSCLASLFSQKLSDEMEILVVENNSTGQEIFDYYKTIEKEHKNVRVLTYQGGFNYSKINNFAAKEARGEVLLLLNNDVTLEGEDTLSRMLGLVRIPSVAMVGLKLLYPDGTVQHGGVAMGMGGVAGHFYWYNAGEDPGYGYGAVSLRELSAVTAACVMIKRSVFDELSGLCETLEVAFNDIDFCVRVKERGDRILYLPSPAACHAESKSRGLDTEGEKQQRFMREVQYFMDVHKDVLEAGDPFFNINFPRDRGDFSLRAPEMYLSDLPRLIVDEDKT